MHLKLKDSNYRLLLATLKCSVFTESRVLLICYTLTLV